MYVCDNCGYSTISKLGKCPECNQFWTFKVFNETEDKNEKWNILKSNEVCENKFYDLENEELKRVFTNGIKSSWIYLLWWQPWVGKSTIVLQILNSLKDNIKVAYFSGEEESSAINSRYKRLFGKDVNFEIFHTTSLEDILETLNDKNIDLFILDSIQTVYSNQSSWVAGSINQVKYCSEKISEFSKNKWIACIIIWHITKSGEIAWPKYLEHIVDMVAYLEWDRLNEYRFLRTQKNRFGGTDDVAIFQMTEKWLKSVFNLQDIVKENYSANPGTAFSVWIDNGRPVLTTIEVLLNKTKYKFPKRSTIWVDSSRVEMIIAILERYLNINLEFFDVFINIPWEFKFYDSWLDLAIAAGIYSAYKNKVIPMNNVFIWEISLSGKISKSSFHVKRVKEVSWFDTIDFKILKDIRKIVEFI